MKLNKANGFKRTEWSVMVSMTTWYAVWRRVWEKDGKFYVSYNKEIHDVTFRKDGFTKW